MSVNRGGWIGVDLDGTLAHYTHWVSITHIGAPIAPMVNRVKAWLRSGKTVKILTARINVPGVPSSEIENAKRAIHEWCLTHIGAVLEVTCSKDTNMVELWDDRAIQVTANTGMPVVACDCHKTYPF